MKHLGLDVELFVLTLWNDSGESVCFDHNQLFTNHSFCQTHTQDKTKITKKVD